MELPKPIRLSAEQRARLLTYLDQKCRSLETGLKELFETRLPDWRRAYEAIPLEAIREFPFHGASNLVVPIIGIHADTLLARVMAAVFKTKPLWGVRALGQHGAVGDDAREALEEALGFYGEEPAELDLYRVYREFYHDIIRYGTSVLKTPWETLIESVPAGDGFAESVTYDGPRPEKIPFNDFFISPTAKTLERAGFKAHRRRMEREELEEKAYLRIYERSAVNKILTRPDFLSPDFVQQQKEADAGAKTVPGYGFAEWHVWECWCRWRLNEEGLPGRIVATYHPRTKTLLRVFYSPYPDEPFVAGRLFFRDDMFHGYGFCELLAPFQEEISQQHNQRRDAQTVANANFARVDPDSKLNSGYKIFPGALVPGAKDEIEVMKFGEPGQMTIDEERLSLDLAEKRSGVSPPQSGSGTGGITKRGVYSAMGTMAVMQETNSRTGLNISDIQYAHTKLGRIIARQLAELGRQPERFKRFGEKAPLILKALEALRGDLICLPISASIPSVNREVEKQNDMLLSNLMMRHYDTIAKMIAGAENPGTPPAVKDYIVKAVASADRLMRRILQNFGFSEPQVFVPEPGGGGGGQGQQPVQPALPAPQQGAEMAAPGGLPAGNGGGGQALGIPTEGPGGIQ